MYFMYFTVSNALFMFSAIGHGPNPEKGIFLAFVATFWRQSEYT